MKKLALCGAVALSLSACAGGMNGGTTGNNNQNNIVTQYPVEATMLNIYTKARSQSLVATVGNQSASADITITPKGSMVFNNKSVQGAEVNTINKTNNQITDQSVVINYFTLNPLIFHGFTDSSGEYSLATQTTTIPKMATVGSSSQLLTEDIYADSSKRKKTGTYKQDWSLTRDTNNTAWFCIETSQNLLLANDPDGTSSECYKINNRGDILDSKVTINQPTSNGLRTILFTSR
ncbi:hypothetical protein [Psychrobacter sp. DAB_AL32B]|uniref:hypothetical protein n=1 Tax=Psychrobacter sp. DAB_AL32B TaxID=1028414 RepID=UPI000B7EE5B9|nr:hypothetical protein [Psychrobacter sp. DAB_AL32B]OXL26180.1 hypothetical protein CAN34_03260 [Psychrobacter sp. DAB_AL32B]